MITSRQLRDRQSPARRALRALARRVTLAIRDGGMWGVVGHVYRTLEGVEFREQQQIEVFEGIGFAARPPDGANAEAIVVQVGGDNGHPVIVATRDEDNRFAIGADEAAVWNSQVVVYLKSDGTVEVRTIAGAAVALATKADIDALQAWADAHIHNDPVSGVTTVPTVGAPTATGTSVLKGE